MRKLKVNDNAGHWIAVVDLDGQLTWSYALPEIGEYHQELIEWGRPCAWGERTVAATDVPGEPGFIPAIYEALGWRPYIAEAVGDWSGSMPDPGDLPDGAVP
jgi:hypothetical protein